HDRAGRGQHDDRDLRVALAEVPSKTEAVLARHVDVHQREVDRMRRGDLLCRSSALGTQRRIGVGNEIFLEHLAYVRLVIDDQDCRFRDNRSFSLHSGLRDARGDDAYIWRNGKWYRGHGAPWQADRVPFDDASCRTSLKEGRGIVNVWRGARHLLK